MVNIFQNYFEDFIDICYFVWVTSVTGRCVLYINGGIAYNKMNRVTGALKQNLGFRTVVSDMLKIKCKNILAIIYYWK